MTETLLLSVLIIAISVLLLCIKTVLLKDGRFSSYHIGDSPAMRKRNIHCVLRQDAEARRKRSVNIKTDNINK